MRRLGIANKKMLFLFGTSLDLHSVACGEGRRRLGIANKKMLFLFGTSLDLHYLCTKLKTIQLTCEANGLICFANT